MPIYAKPVRLLMKDMAHSFALQPGQTWQIIPGQTTPTSVNAASSGHQFTAVYF